MKHFSKLILPIFLMFFMVSCGIHDYIIKDAEKTIKYLDVIERGLKNEKANYETFKKSREGQNHEYQVKIKDFDNNFMLASKKLDLVKKNLLVLKTFLEKDRKKDSKKTRIQIESIKVSYKNIDELTFYVSNKINFIKKTKTNLVKIKNELNESYENYAYIHLNLIQYLQKAIIDYPKKEKDLLNKIKNISTLYEKNKNTYEVAQSELRKTSLLDYALIGDALIDINVNLKNLTEIDKQYRTKVLELYKSYSKILVDMKKEYYVQTGLSTWDESSSNGEKSYLYKPRLVTKEVFEYFNKNTISPLYSVIYYQRYIRVNLKMWNALRIGDISFKSGHNSASIWLKGTLVKYYHKYIIVEENTSKKTKWEDVRDDYYLKQEGNLGMEILSKPFGKYEVDISRVATPAGLSVVGNEKYGEWRKEKNPKTGQNLSYWHYYGMYSFMSNIMGPRHRYYYNDWNYYNNNHRGRNYYGRENEYGTWGSRTYSGSYYSNSSYSRTNSSIVRDSKNGKYSGKNSQNRAKMTSTLRGHTSKTRSRGPGGGGK